MKPKKASFKYQIKRSLNRKSLIVKYLNKFLLKNSPNICIFLIIALFRVYLYHFTDNHHLGFEAGILY